MFKMPLKPISTTYKQIKYICKCKKIDNRHFIIAMYSNVVQDSFRHFWGAM